MEISSADVLGGHGQQPEKRPFVHQLQWGGKVILFHIQNMRQILAPVYNTWTMVTVCDDKGQPAMTVKVADSDFRSYRKATPQQRDMYFAFMLPKETLLGKLPSSASFLSIHDKLDTNTPCTASFNLRFNSTAFVRIVSAAGFAYDALSEGMVWRITGAVRTRAHFS